MFPKTIILLFKKIIFHAFHTKFAKLNDSNHIGNVSPICQVTVQSKQYWQSSKMQNLLKLNYNLTTKLIKERCH